MSDSHRASRAVDRLLIRAAMETSKAKQEIRRQRVTQIVFERELELGGLFIREATTKKPYFGNRQEIFSLTDTRELVAYIHDEYGVNASTDWMRAIVAEFTSKTRRHGDAMTGRRFVAFDPKAMCLYMTRWDGTVRVLDGQDILEGVNGDEVFFLDDDHGIDVVDPDIGPHGELINYITDLTFAEETIGGMTPTHQKMLLTVWSFAVAFPDLVTSKPLLIFEGAPGSGKSTVAIMLQALIHGKDHGLIISRDGEKDFPVQLLRNPIAVFDNVDSYIDWIPDAICAYTTVGKWAKRELYSDDNEIVLAPAAFPVVASKNPASFRREDVADRTIILRLERRAGGFLPLQHLMTDLRNRRRKLFGEYLYYCNQIVDAIRAGYWDSSYEHVSSFRQADFAQMAFLVGSVLGWDPEDIADTLDALTREQKAHSAENDDFSDVLLNWLRQHGPRHKGKFLSPRLIYSEMEQIAMSRMSKLKFTEAVLNGRLRMGHLDDRFSVEHIIDHASRQHHYRITLADHVGPLDADQFDNVMPFPAADFNKGR